ncbi:MAG: helix-turn-helix transcriptional regulator [Lentisphaeraceae bacterium]|nr:helix-turn-helix transcriptional regulator [Lentisphaeraceae bacterium]
MKNWITKFTVRDSLQALPRLLVIGRREVFNISYYQTGRRKASFCAFQFTLSGQGYFSFEGKRQLVPAGKGFFFNTCDHGWEYGYPEESREAWEFMYLEFSGDAMIALQREMTQRHGFIFDLSLDSPFIMQLQQYRRSSWTSETISAGQSAAIVYALINELYRQLDANTNGAENALISKAASLVSNHLERSLSAEDLAQQLGVSREHMSRVFRQLLNMSPLHYIRQQKIDYACRLLETSKMNIKEIAARCGFSSDIVFNNSFKKEKNITPGRYRREFLKH